MVSSQLLNASYPTLPNFNLLLFRGLANAVKTLKLRVSEQPHVYVSSDAIASLSSKKLSIFIVLTDENSFC
jgi:hypothetical protein